MVWVSPPLSAFLHASDQSRLTTAFSSARAEKGRKVSARLRRWPRHLRSTLSNDVPRHGHALLAGRDGDAHAGVFLKCSVPGARKFARGVLIVRISLDGDVEALLASARTWLGSLPIRSPTACAELGNRIRGGMARPIRNEASHPSLSNRGTHFHLPTRLRQPPRRIMDLWNIRWRRW